MQLSHTQAFALGQATTPGAQPRHHPWQLGLSSSSSSSSLAREATADQAFSGSQFSRPVCLTAGLLGLAIAQRSGRRTWRLERPRDVSRFALSASPFEEEEEKAVQPAQLVQGRLPSGIVQFRSVYPAQTPRYGQEYDRQAGSTDNVYLLKPEGNPWVMIGAFEGQLVQEFLALLERPGPNRETIVRLGHLVLQYFDGKQLDFVDALIRQRPSDSPPLFIHAAVPIVLALKKNLSKEALAGCRLMPIKKGATLELSPDRMMRFILTPTLMIPEASVAFDPETGTLFSGKFFSAHRTIPNTVKPFDAKGLEGWREYAEDWFHFFDSYFYTKQAQTAIRKVFMVAEGLLGPDVEMIAPLHGPVVRDQAWKLMAKYEAWTEQKVRQQSSRKREVAVMFTSAYGNTATMASSFSQNLAKLGVRVNEINLEHTPMEDVSKAIASCDAFVFGSPTLAGEMPTQAKEALGLVLSSSRDHAQTPCGVFGSYGWSGEAVDELQFRLKDSGYAMAFDPIKTKFRPTDNVLKQCQAAAERLNQKLNQLERARSKSRARNVAQATVATVSNQAKEAFSKVRTSECIVSTILPNGADFLVAVPWVAQASFTPPGLTFSLRKSDLDTILGQTFDEQVNALWEKADKDGSGTLDSEELDSLFRELYDAPMEGVIPSSLQERIDAAVAILDPDEDGVVSRMDFDNAMTEGPLVEELTDYRLSASLEKVLKEDGLKVVMNIVPDGKDTKDLLVDPKPHKKGKAENGCFVHAEAHAFMELEVQWIADAGSHKTLYAHVAAGKVLEASAKTAMVEAGQILKAAPGPAVIA
mmetsp:Transcript_59571/g.141750  ORF Transcript_59571/g.141750 Transcript_59571/m.141750 type:complete len:811 (-) Transcript_59571:138-2570(-)|eukprot:CAMPEP_0178443780 /NCGR_PEP_ID=MMETSP0689_2-20121128/39100_1 /TAXON_ID=160604 /ORGANISM="Amphidinium massartii, Strain CS-259" /LENGTH=810 /DNA_ID=CAMNT_0020067855 /DNA_START=42 /DNA_END=2474 /DNA_ORIENTATION=+